jgi:hypothetical protein
MQEQQENYMRQYLDLEEPALAAGNPPVGVLMVFSTPTC